MITLTDLDSFKHIWQICKGYGHCFHHQYYSQVYVDNKNMFEWNWIPEASIVQMLSLTM